MKSRTKSLGIALTVVLTTARLGRGTEERSLENQESSPSAAAQRGELAGSILAAKERALGEPFGASMRASLKTRMEALSMEQLKALAEQGESADLPSMLGSVTSDLVYTPVTPCRAFDSRVSQGGPGPIPANTQRNVFVAGTVGFQAQGGMAGGCGIPVGATSAIINFVTVLPAGPGNIRAWAVASPQPPAPLAAVVNYGLVAGLPAIANGVPVPLCDPAATDCTLGDLRLQADTNSTDILGDVVGYFGPAVGGFVDLTTAQTVGGSKAFSSPIVGSITGSAASVTGIVPVANGGTGSATQNFVDLTTAQTVGGDKTLTGNLDIGASTTNATGNIMKGGARFIHNYGAFNTFIGEGAGNFTMTGSANTASGVSALRSNVSGFNNTASGWGALQFNTAGARNTASGVGALRFNTTGINNTASGQGALQGNTTGSYNTAGGMEALVVNTTGEYNTASGTAALYFNTTGNHNTASGVYALFNNTAGSNNIGVGADAGRNLTTGSNNIDIGNVGVAGDSNTIRIGTPGTHTATFIAGNTTTFSGNLAWAGTSAGSISGNAATATTVGLVCAEGEVFKWISGVWNCGTDAVATGVSGWEARLQAYQQAIDAQAVEIASLKRQAEELRRLAGEVAALKQELASVAVAAYEVLRQRR